MTWSIIARDRDTGRIGIAVATCNFAVGARVPFIKSSIGAVASQAMTNQLFGPRGLTLLENGASAEDAVAILTRGDDGRDHRQLHVMDTAGRHAAYTGERCIPWCGHLVRDACSVAGNMLTGADVIEATAETFEKQSALPFARRLLTAMLAGEVRGGDKRGKQSAALLIYGKDEYPLYDIRVDDHAEPLVELARLEAVARDRFVHYLRFAPGKAHPHGVLDRDELERRIAASKAEGYE